MARKSKIRTKTEIMTYAVAVTTEEVFRAIRTEKEETIKAVTDARKGCVGVYPTPEQQFLLYFAPGSRDKACMKLKAAGFKSAKPVKTPALVDVEHLKGKK